MAPRPTAGDASLARVVLAATLLLTFWPALAGGFVADDIRLLDRNPALRSGDLTTLLTAPMFGVERGYWRPLTMLTLWLGHALGGAVGIHLLSLLLHLGNAFAVRALALRFATPASALWVAVLFLVHPVQVESVAWCSAINDPLWVACALQAMLAARRCVERGGPVWLVAIWILLALLAKETGVVAVPLAIAAACCRPSTAGRWRVLGAGLLALAGWLVLRAIVLGEQPTQILWRPAATDAIAGATPLRSAQLVLAQLELLVAPLPVHPVRSVPALPGDAIWPLALLGASTLVVALAWRRFGSGVRLGIVLVLLPVLPTIAYERVVGLYPIADRYLYLAVAGFGLLLASLPIWRWRLLPWLAVVPLAPVAFLNVWNWYDLERFTTHLLAHADRDPMVLVMAADVQLNQAFAGDRSRLPVTQDLYERGLRAIGERGGNQMASTQARGLIGLAWCLLFQRRSGADGEQRLLDAFAAAAAVAPNDPTVWVGFGIARSECGQREAAAAAFEQALRLDPQNEQARRGLERLRAGR